MTDDIIQRTMDENGRTRATERDRRQKTAKETRRETKFAGQRRYCADNKKIRDEALDELRKLAPPPQKWQIQSWRKRQQPRDGLRFYAHPAAQSFLGSFRVSCRRARRRNFSRLILLNCGAAQQGGRKPCRRKQRESP